jgi:chorismate mutase
VDESAERELSRLRSSIDNLDAALVHLLAERFKRTEEVGRLKAAHDLPPADPAREAAQIARLRGLAKAARLDPAVAERFLSFIIEEVVRHHEVIARAGTVDALGRPRSAESEVPSPHDDAGRDPLEV